MQMTDWFLAQEKEAEAIASIVTTEEHAPEDWTHLEFPLMQMDLMALCATLLGDEEQAAESVLEEPLVWDEEGGLCVARVKDTFIQALARVKPGGVEALVEAWQAQLEGGEHEPEELSEYLTQLADFARDAVKKRSPVIELNTF